MSAIPQPAVAHDRVVPASGVAFGRILWACDFSAGSLRALRWVVPLARAAYGSEITALHVIPTSLPAAGGPLALTDPGLLRPGLRHDVSARLDRCLGPAVAASVPTHVVLREGHPAQQILREACSLPADLVVVGTRGRGGLERSVMGSVAEAVLGRAPCPVLAVPAAAPPSTAGELPKVVLWATDFSRHAANALPHALWISARSAADLVLVHVVEPGTLGDNRERIRAAEQRLGEMGVALRGRRLLRIVGLGNPALEILRVARERKAGLVVMGTQGSRTLHSVFFGSTARRVIRGAPCPVLAVPRA